MKRFVQLIFTTLCLGGFLGCASEPPAVQRVAVIDDVALRDVLANPTHFDHLRVRVKAVARIEFEGTSLYPDRTTLASKQRDKAIWLEVGWPVKDELLELNGRDVVVEGTFDVSKRGHFGAYSGSIIDISKIAPVQ